MTRACRAARKAVRSAVVWAPLIAAALFGVSPARAASSAHLNINIGIVGIGSVLDLNAAPAVSSGSIDLTWTEPYRNAGVAPYSYDVRASTLAQISNDAEFAAALPLSAFSASVPPAPGAGGGAAGFVVTGLTQSVTYYFAIREKDSTTVVGAWQRSVAKGWNVSNFAVATSTGPSAPSGLRATAGVLAIALNWDEQAPSASGAGLHFYRISRSLTAGSGFVSLTTTAANSYVDRHLPAGVTYYYKLSARDVTGAEGPYSAVASTAAFTVPPMEPLGVTVTATANDVTLAWSPVRYLADGTPIRDPDAPTNDELTGYSVYRSTAACELEFVHITSVPYATLSLLNATGGNNYYYHVYSYNSAGVSTNTLTISTLGERRFFTDQCSTMMMFDAANSAMLDGDTNGLGVDIQIKNDRRPQDVGGAVYQSAEWRAYLDGVTELKTFTLPKPARLIMHYDTDGGRVVPTTAPVTGLSVAGAAPSAAAPMNASAKDLGIYWYNGGEFKKMYGNVDSNSQTVTVETPNLGLYQIRALFRSDGAVFDISNLSGRVITPNGDGRNDLLIFGYDPGPRNAQVRGRIYDMTGAFVADMTGGLVPNTIVWDGKMNGRAVTSGVYVYKIEGDGKTFTGTVVVAR